MNGFVLYDILLPKGLINSSRNSFVSLVCMMNLYRDKMDLYLVAAIKVADPSKKDLSLNFANIS